MGERRDPYAQAVLTAALDAARLGAQAPLTTEFLRAAAPGYCSPAEGRGSGNWFEQALAYATPSCTELPLPWPPPDPGWARSTDISVADYLLQHVARERRAAHVPASAWDAFLAHVRDPVDAARLADSAERRLLYCYAIPLNRHAAEADDRDAARQLASLLARRGDLQEAQQILRVAADADDRSAAEELAQLLDDCGEVDQLRARADLGDEPAARQLAWLRPR